jgi:hypothetical protein
MSGQHIMAGVCDTAKLFTSWLGSEKEKEEEMGPSREGCQ